MYHFYHFLQKEKNETLEELIGFKLDFHVFKGSYFLSNQEQEVAKNIFKSKTKFGYLTRLEFGLLLPKKGCLTPGFITSHPKNNKPTLYSVHVLF